MHRSRGSFIVIALGIILCILSFANFVVYEGIVLAFSPLNPLASFYFLLSARILFIALTLSFVLASLLCAKYNTFFTRIFYRVSAAWTGCLLYFFFAALIYILYLLLGPPSIVLASILFGLALLTGIYGVAHANTIKIKHVVIDLPNLPESWKNRRAVFVSDLHLGQVRGTHFAEKVCRKIRAINPDIVFIGGDMYDGVAVDAGAIMEPFKNLNEHAARRQVPPISAAPPLGMYFVTGNHEEFSDNSKYVEVISAAGIKVLCDEKIEIDGLEIIGVDYKTTNTALKFKNVMDSITLDPSKPSILLKHVPLHVEVAAEKGISLQLSGHTHKAQVFPFNLLTPSMFKGFDYGLKKSPNLDAHQNDGSLTVLTSSGVGTWGPPLRIGTNSEIIVLDFNPAFRETSDKSLV